MTEKIGLFTGSFDPVTLGHIDLLTRSSALFDKLYVGLFDNVAKVSFFPIEVRSRMLKKALIPLTNVEVVTATGVLAVDVAKELGVTHLVRGLRSSKDLDYEAELAFFNHHLDDTLESVFLLANPEFVYVSSSRVREMIHFGADITPFVPESVLVEMESNESYGE
ncbi:pantetheine-phosphate adenylyltransferase [Streptococcus sciuri]|uniref:Phosphopantetheine adenylyltransferase n=1 Tax=Streptococcus sciuri TaxID=2973939 RepID=A0ABT2F6Q5_9STRE|nr:pantetheine-phosphate adenylyltransferase [Streptococcus sciuri]MCS4488119.1 pantetheine-phosphate adenylyltransferase [Streptococcus sciuri]